jgi:hypothetical protein
MSSSIRGPRPTESAAQPSPTDEAPAFRPRTQSGANRRASPMQLARQQPRPAAGLRPPPSPQQLQLMKQERLGITPDVVREVTRLYNQLTGFHVSEEQIADELAGYVEAGPAATTATILGLGAAGINHILLAGLPQLLGVFPNPVTSWRSKLNAIPVPRPMQGPVGPKPPVRRL